MYQTAQTLSDHTASAPVHVSEVYSAVEHLAANTEQLDNLLTEMEQRLNCVLAQRDTDGKNQPSSPEPVRVPLARLLVERAHHVNVLSDRVQSIMARLEL